MDLAILSTEYALLVYIFSNPNWKKTHFIFCGRIDEKMIQKMKMFGAKNILAGEKWAKVVNEIQLCPRNSSRRQYLRILKEYMRIKMQIKAKLFCMWNHKNIHVFAQTDNSISSFCHDYNFNLIEDGVFNYEISLVKTGGGSLVPLSDRQFVKNIYLTGRLSIPEEIKRKVVLVDIKRRWKELNTQERQEIIGLFHFDYYKLLNLVKNGRDKILLTQNFYRYGRCTVEEQVQIYREILSDYDMKEIIIKPHPEDAIDYKKYFPECYLLKDKFPFELCFFTNLPLKKLISVNSTSTYGLWDEVYIERHEEMLERLKDLS